MPITPSRDQQDQFIIDNAGKMPRQDITRELHLTKGQYSNRIRVLQRKGLLGQLPSTSESPPAAQGPGGQPSFTQDESTNAKVLTSLMADIKTLDDLLAYAQVDLTVWEVERFKVNKWEGYAKTSSRKVGPGHHVKDITKTDLWQVTAHLRRKAGQSIAEFRAELIADMKKVARARPLIKYPKLAGDRHLLEISIPDVHMGRMSWHRETGKDYDSAIAEARYLECLEDLIAKAKGFNVTKVVMPLGNDLMNVDTPTNMTTAGTPQDVDTRWQKCFVRTRKMITIAIERLSLVAPVVVLVVPGNHDQTKMFYLGDSLASYFRLDPNVTVDNAPTLRKVCRFGNNLIGFTHGNEEVHRELPNLMAREWPQDWADVVKAGGSTAWHLGHFHKKQETRFNVGDTFGGTTVSIIPSLASEDAWHYRRGYVKGLCAAEAYLWSFARGYAGHFSFNANAA